MAVKTKDFKINLSDFTSDGFEINANKKTALRIEELTKSDLENNKLSFAIADNRLVVTNTLNEDKLIVKNYKNIKYIKTDVIGKNYNLFNIISNNLVDNLSDITKYNPKKRTMTGTNYNDTINAKVSDYIVPNTGKNKNKGLTIKAGGGNDIITGTLGNDTITGGAGTTIVNYTKGDGNDVINLTKGENFILNFTDLTKDDLRFDFVNKNKDLRIYTSQLSNDEYITIKNFVKKDVTNNSNYKKHISDTSSVEIIFNNNESTRIDLRTAVDLYSKDITKNYTGSWLPETISGEDYIKYAWYKTEEGEKELFEVEDWSKKGLTIKAGGGNDNIIGSSYSDTIYGGSGDDTIKSGYGNDKLTGGSGNNTFVFSSEDDTNTITDAKKGDIIKITDTNSDSLEYYRNNNNLQISFSGTKIIIQNYFKSNNKIERLIAEDREVLISEEARGYSLVGTGTLRGNSEDNTILSRGKSTVNIYAGRGSDTIYAGAKKSVMYFYEGDGDDTIIDDYDYYVEEEDYSTSNTLVFKAGTNLSFERKFNTAINNYGYINTYQDLVISYGSLGDTIMLKNYHEDDNFYIKIGNKTKRLSSMYKIPTDISVSGENGTYEGTDGDDRIILQAKRSKNSKNNLEEVINIKNNIIHAKDGNDCIIIGSGSEFDVISNNTIYAEGGDDYISCSSDSTIYAGDGDDYIKCSYDSNSIVYTGKGNDNIYVKSGLFHFESGDGNDTVFGENYSDLFLAFDNEDSVDDIDIILNEDNSYLFKYNNEQDSVALNSEYSHLNAVILNNNDLYLLQNNENGNYAGWLIDANCIQNIIGDNNINIWVTGAKNSDSLNIEISPSVLSVGNDSSNPIGIFKGVKTFNGDDTIDIYGTQHDTDGAIQLLAGGGSDTYKINYVYGNSQGQLISNYYTIYDESGSDDKINYENSKWNALLRFDIAVDEDGNIIENLSKNMYITKTSDFGKEVGIKVVDQFVEGKAIETITTADNYVLTSSQINQLRSDIAGWLHDNGFESVQQILDSNNETNINNLITEFQKVDWQFAGQ